MSSKLNLAIGFTVLFSISLLSQDAEAQRFRIRYRNCPQPVRYVPPNCSNFRSVAPAQTIAARPYLPPAATQPNYGYTVQPVNPVLNVPMPAVPTAKQIDPVQPPVIGDAPPATQTLNPVVPPANAQQPPNAATPITPVPESPPTVKPILNSPGTLEPVPKGDAKAVPAIDFPPAALPPKPTPAGAKSILDQSK